MNTNHVVSLELSLALRDAGYPQEGSTFYWLKAGDVWDLNYWWVDNVFGLEVHDSATAPLASELGEMLMDGRLTQYCFKQTQGWGWKSFTFLGTPVVFTEYSDTEADARAKMLIHLLENKLITL